MRSTSPFDDRDPHIAQLSEVTILCNFFSYDAGGKRCEGDKHAIETLTTRSTDNGHTWSEPMPVDVN